MELLSEYALEVFELVAYLIGAGLLSGIGLYVESLAYASYLAGEIEVAAWFAAAGAIALYVGVYAVGATELLPRLRAYRSA